MVDSEAAPPGKLGAQATLVGRLRVYKADGGATTGGGACSDGDGWQRGIVASLCPRGTFSHVVAYTRQASALRGTVDMLLDAASYGSRWMLLSPASAAGVARALRPRPPRHCQGPQV